MARVGLMPGDGIGPEVLDAALLVLGSAGFEGEYVPLEVGWRWWCEEGEALPTRTIEALGGCACALFGAITSKGVQEAEVELRPELRGQGLRYVSPIVRLRQMFDLYAAVRPCRAFSGNPRNIRDGVDIVVFRENTEGLYCGLEWHPLPESLAHAMGSAAEGHPDRMRRWFDAGLDDVSMSARMMSRGGCERIVRAAFEYARAHGRQHVTLLEKPNVLRATGGLMTRVFRSVSAEYPGIGAREAAIDAACMQLITDPSRFDVVVAENMFGDIVSDLASGLVGGLGFAPSANLGERFAVFEPTHGSAPDIAGQGIANPIAMILSGAMMAAWLGQGDVAERIELAVESVIAAGEVDTPDVAGPDATGTTMGVAERIADRVAGMAVERSLA